MLQALRRQASSWIVKILFAFLILSFGLWGINDIFLGERDPTVATVSGHKITFNQLNEGLRQEVTRFAPLFGGDLDRNQAKQLGLIDQALDKLVDRAVFANVTDSYGLLVSDDMIRAHIQAEQAFRNTLGQFDRRMFQQVLSQYGMTEAGYIAGLRRDLATNQLIGAVTANTPAPVNLLDSLHRYREEGRVADTIFVPASQAPTPPVPDQAMIEKQYQATIERYMSPELRAVSYVLIDPAALLVDAPIPEAQLQAEYEARIDVFTVRAKRDLDQVVLNSEAEAQKIAGLLSQGKSLDQALKEADVAVTPVKLGLTEKIDLIPEIAEPAFALKAGESSAPIRSPLGWHVLKINGAEEGRVKPFAEVREELRRDMAEYAADKEAHDIAIRLEDAFAGGANLEEAAARAGLKLVKLPPMTIAGLTADNKPASPLFNDPRLIRAAFSTPQGQDSPLIEMAKNAFLVLRVDEVKPPVAKPLEEVRADVIAAWQDEQRMIATRNRAEGMATRIAKGETPAAVAAAEKLALKTTPVFTRMSHDEENNLPESLKAQLFDVGGTAIGESRDGYVVGTLKDVKPAPDLPPEARAQLSNQLGEAMANDLIDQLSTAMRARYRVEVRRDIIDSRF